MTLLLPTFTTAEVKQVKSISVCCWCLHFAQAQKARLLFDGCPYIWMHNKRYESIYVRVYLCDICAYGDICIHNSCEVLHSRSRICQLTQI